MSSQIHSNHQEKTCSRCHLSFICKAGEIEQCDCRQIKLTHEETQYIFKKYGDCVCNACLLKLKQEYAQHDK